MIGKTRYIAIEAIILSILLFIPNVVSDDAVSIPSDKSQLNSWFHENVRPFGERKDTLNSTLVTAEDGAKIIKVRKDGGGDFKTVTDAINSIPIGNTNRVIVWIGGGNYTEKIRIERTKPFITFYGDPKDMPTLIYSGTAAQYGTVDSASVIVESDFFSAVNIIFANSAPRPNGGPGQQALALRIRGDKASFYNCKMLGFQDTLCDDRGRHFYKDCYIEGTVDFIFGAGKSLYLNTEVHVIPGDGVAYITAHARQSETVDTGFSFVHCMVTGTGSHAFLGRAWMSHPRVVFSHTEISDVITPKGWSDNFHPERGKTVYFGEYNCKGPGANLDGRVPFVKKFTSSEVKRFINLAYIEGSQWLLPPAKV